MAQQHAINGTNINYIARADWGASLQGDGLDGNSPLTRWRRHTWRTNVMPVTEFDVIYALEGTQVNITTTNYSDRNGAYITYYNCDLNRVDGRHEGPRMEDVVCEFLVRIG